MQSNNFSMFHVNTRSLTKHFDQLYSLICAIKIPFDVIGLTETKQSINKDFLLNVNIDGYQLHTQPTKSLCGGTAIHVKKSLDHKVLHDLNALEDEFETLWIKLIQDIKAKI